ncbi:hypothetical protein EYF80_014691 [Liparis tanakae]|uniref:Uncharacterized protein n=1 Tax=Liparis tanakae TaxID=230148 RepID=A0A4Z2IAT9_9TELE|nr:hypothetical protein EYF80_014691 [Liparis tanakae]
MFQESVVWVLPAVSIAVSMLEMVDRQPYKVLCILNQGRLQLLTLQHLKLDQIGFVTLGVCTPDDDFVLRSHFSPSQSASVGSISRHHAILCLDFIGVGITVSQHAALMIVILGKENAAAGTPHRLDPGDPLERISSSLKTRGRRRGRRRSRRRDTSTFRCDEEDTVCTIAGELGGEEERRRRGGEEEERRRGDGELDAHVNTCSCRPLQLHHEMDIDEHTEDWEKGQQGNLREESASLVLLCGCLHTMKTTITHATVRKPRTDTDQTARRPWTATMLKTHTNTPGGEQKTVRCAASVTG